MSRIYHDRGIWGALLRPPVRHLRTWWRDPAYRALHRFARGATGRRGGIEHFGQWPVEWVDGPSFLSAWDEIFVNRIYDLGEPTRAGRPVLVDAGANIGLAALYWKIKYGECAYLGFEPDPEMAACARRNLARWGVSGELRELALAEAEGTGRFVADGADGGHLVPPQSPAAEGIEVATARLSTLLPPVVDLLKIDVEGAEAAVLADVAPRLGQVRALFVEWHAAGGVHGLGEAMALLEHAGFACFVQVARGPARPFLLTGEALAASPQNINLYAVRR
jgi:FkbM family methyltransferase